MKRTIVCVLVVLVIGIISSHVLMAVPQGSGDKDNYGTIVGQIVDEKNGNAVNEIFKVILLNCSDENAPFFFTSITSDERGHFSLAVVPGLYCLIFSPTLETSIYSFDKPIRCQNASRLVIKVEAGKISRVTKKAKLGGRLHLELVDKNAKRVIPSSIFPNTDMKKISVDINKYSECLEGVVGYHTIGEDSLDDGEMQLNCLPSGEYNFGIYLSSMGHPPIFLENIKVEEGKITEQVVLVDLTDVTGLEGTISDNKGNPVVKAKVAMIKNDNDEYFATSRTDNSGSYRFVGLDEGFYKLKLTIDISDTKFIFKSYKNIYISKNKILRKDIVIQIQ